MAAQLTTEYVTVKIRRYKVDRMGYLFCGHHLDSGIDGRVFDLLPGDEHHGKFESPRTDRCDRCGRKSDAWPAVERILSTTVEHTPSRIF